MTSPPLGDRGPQWAGRGEIQTLQGAADALGITVHLECMTLSVQNPDELIAAIPHLLGFRPQESIVSCR
jgi:hypothetical protein